MPRAKAKAADESSSAFHARSALDSFRAMKKIVLRRVAGELVTKRKAVEAMRRYYAKLWDEYRRYEGTTYRVWCDVVMPELDEVVAAASDDAIWDRLVDTYEERDHAG